MRATLARRRRDAFHVLAACNAGLVSCNSLLGRVPTEGNRTENLAIENHRRILDLRVTRLRMADEAVVLKHLPRAAVDPKVPLTAYDGGTSHRPKTFCSLPPRLRLVNGQARLTELQRQKRAMSAPNVPGRTPKQRTKVLRNYLWYGMRDGHPIGLTYRRSPADARGSVATDGDRQVQRRVSQAPSHQSRTPPTAQYALAASGQEQDS
jgi:hypothetical protein